MTTWDSVYVASGAIASLYKKTTFLEEMFFYCTCSFSFMEDIGGIFPMWLTISNLGWGGEESLNYLPPRFETNS